MAQALSTLNYLIGFQPWRVKSLKLSSVLPFHAEQVTAAGSGSPWLNLMPFKSPSTLDKHGIQIVHTQSVSNLLPSAFFFFYEAKLKPKREREEFNLLMSVFLVLKNENTKNIVHSLRQNGLLSLCLS